MVSGSAALGLDVVLVAATMQLSVSGSIAPSILPRLIRFRRASTLSCTFCTFGYMLKDGVLRVNHAVQQVENALIMRSLQQVVTDQQSFGVRCRSILQPFHQPCPRVER